ncbi:MAG: polyketide cyclase [Ignavibacteriae bacterium HGW-Ignavibacteriae-2]|jgi:uncharacterized protein YndB with AHSA1/START domain|nr:SRPBCC family protein [Bacteroidota bacterium]PKL88660.1 MAG: polyketide cyclase [Ignavibacteriae bacterium HGW-Ignavibacteriae-2]
MEPTNKIIITVQAIINAPVEIVWKNWTTPEDVVNWNYASEDWHSTRAENDLRVGGKFNYRMEAKDGSMGFDFEGVYDNIINKQQIDYTLGDGRIVKITFSDRGDTTEVVESFEAEEINSIELQRGGWQAILNNFKKYVEIH